MLSIESIKIDINVPTKMRDGIILYADVYRPERQGQYPAILTRLPYNKNVEFPKASGYMDPIAYVRAGYAVVIQDVRGTGASEGQAFFWRQELEDSYDSVEFIAAQPWCDGNIGMYGYSYFGYTQWTAAVTQPPHLKTICPGFTNTVPHAFPFSIKGDKLRLKIHLSWSLIISTLGLLRSRKSADMIKTQKDNLTYLRDHFEEQSWFLPIKDSPAIRTIDDLGMTPGFSDLISHVDGAQFWEQIGGPLPLEKVKVPVFHVVGWYDVDMLPAVINSYLTLNRYGAFEGSQLKQKLLVGPWVHSSDMLNKVGELDFGQNSSGAVADITGMHIRWFDHWLKGVNNGVRDEAPIRIFVMGSNKWRDENEWPLARTKYMEYYFHSGGQANSRFGDGVLSEELPGDEQPDNYLYDPRNPVMSNEMGAGAFDQQEIEKRPDVLVYTSEPLKSDLEVTGPIQIKIWASSSAVDTDFTGKLVDVWPNGKAYNICEGIIRTGYKQSERPKPLKPGGVGQYVIDMGATSNVFKAGHCIRVEISSSDFPHWERNLNTGHPIGQDATINSAMQTIHHTSQLSSHIVLPIIK